MNETTIRTFDNLDGYIEEIQNPKADIAIYNEGDGTFRACAKGGSPAECLDLPAVNAMIWELLAV